MEKLQPSPVPYQEYLDKAYGTPENKSNYNYKVHKSHIRKSYEKNKALASELGSGRKFSSATASGTSLAKALEFTRNRRDFVKENKNNPCLKSYDNLELNQPAGYAPEETKSLSKIILLNK